MIIDCPRCNATGHIDEFAHIANGTCFLCCCAKRINLSSVQHREGVELYVSQTWNGQACHIVANLLLTQKNGETLNLSHNKHFFAFDLNKPAHLRRAREIVAACDNLPIQHFIDSPHWQTY